MDDETRKTVLVAYQKRKQDEIIHPFLEEKVPVGMLFYIQALLMARYLRDDLGILLIILIDYKQTVAPRAGAWIETLCLMP
jgi:hypothetical protein